MAGLQCELRLWKQVHTPPPYQEPQPGTPQYEGTRIGELARKLFPGGVLIDNSADDFKGALERTRGFMATGCPAIFEAGFEHGDRRIRVDVLKHVGETRWALYEIKSSTSIHHEHYDDAVFQADVLRRSGIDLHSVYIGHVNRDYRRGPDGIDLSKLFSFIDVSELLGDRYEKLTASLASITTVIGSTAPPTVAPGLHCWKPYDCEFFDQCGAALPSDWVGKLPRVRKGQLDLLIAAGITNIAEIPAGFPLTVLQERIRLAHKAGEPFVAQGVREVLRPLGPPALYLDFESMMPGIPMYSGTGPYQQIPFLFSLHRDEGGLLSHSDFIALPGEDPRRDFAEELIRQTSAAEGPIVVYSHYEKRIVSELANAMPDLASDLEKIIARLQDLLGILRKTVYLPAFNGSYKIKDVGPVLARVSYADLDIQDGTKAAAAYQSLVEGTAPRADASRTLLDLRAYCERDTLAMVRVHRALLGLVSDRPPSSGFCPEP